MALGQQGVMVEQLVACGVHVGNPMLAALLAWLAHSCSVDPACWPVRAVGLEWVV